jgi:hypothetical protein
MTLVESNPMATPVHTPAAQHIPGEKAYMPALVLIAGWLVPGAGHLLLGKWIRASLICISVLGMFLIGIGLAGKIYTPNTGDILDILGFVGQLGTGILYVIARVFGLGATAAVNTLADYGTKAIVIAGMLNIIAAVDAHSLANGRKASF